MSKDHKQVIFSVPPHKHTRLVLKLDYHDIPTQAKLFRHIVELILEEDPDMNAVIDKVKKRMHISTRLAAKIKRKLKKQLKENKEAQEEKFLSKEELEEILVDVEYEDFGQYEEWEDEEGED